MSRFGASDRVTPGVPFLRQMHSARFKSAELVTRRLGRAELAVVESRVVHAPIGCVD